MGWHHDRWRLHRPEGSWQSWRAAARRWRWRWWWPGTLAMENPPLVEGWLIGWLVDLVNGWDVLEIENQSIDLMCIGGTVIECKCMNYPARMFTLVVYHIVFSLWCQVTRFTTLRLWGFFCRFTGLRTLMRCHGPKRLLVLQTWRVE